MRDANHARPCTPKKLCRKFHNIVLPLSLFRAFSIFLSPSLFFFYVLAAYFNKFSWQFSSAICMPNTARTVHTDHNNNTTINMFPRESCERKLDYMSNSTRLTSSPASQAGLCGFQCANKYAKISFN